jgi:hypothetical protein
VRVRFVGVPGELEERQRVAVREIEDACSFGGVELLARAGEQRGRRRGVKPVQLELRQLASREWASFAGPRREESRHCIRPQAPNGECERVGGRGIEPVRIVDEEQKRTLLRSGGEQRERCRPDRERRRALLFRKPERRPERFRLSWLEPPEPVEDRPAKLEQRTERQPGLRLRAARVDDPEAARAPSGVLEERRLPIPGSPTSTSAALMPSRAASSSASMRRCSLPRPTSTLEG